MLDFLKKKWLQEKENGRLENQILDQELLWKYAQTVGPAYLGAPTHPGKKKEVKDYSEI